jgi:hypothetical protein
LQKIVASSSLPAKQRGTKRRFPHAANGDDVLRWNGGVVSPLHFFIIYKLNKNAYLGSPVGAREYEQRRLALLSRQ